MFCAMADKDVGSGNVLLDVEDEEVAADDGELFVVAKALEAPGAPSDPPTMAEVTLAAAMAATAAAP